jgi:putative effector of murein hydrolase
MSQPSSPPPRRPLWHWFVLFTPALEVLLLTALNEPLSKLLPFYGGHYGFEWLIWNLLLAGVGCLAIGIWWKWHQFSDLSLKILAGILVGVAVAAVNGGIALSGCAAGLTLLR